MVPGPAPFNVLWAPAANANHCGARGQFGAGALQFNRLRKQSYVAVVKSLGLVRRVIWQATNESEQCDIRRVVGRNANTVVAPNLTDFPHPLQPREPKQPGRLNLCCCAEYCP